MLAAAKKAQETEGYKPIKKGRKSNLRNHVLMLAYTQVQTVVQHGRQAEAAEAAAKGAASAAAIAKATVPGI
jgi:hypothetical protein